jgi:hypothetical protein
MVIDRYGGGKASHRRVVQIKTIRGAYMVVFDVIVNGQIKETLTPANQRLREMHWFMVDRIQIMKEKYGDNFQISRRIIS